MCACPRRTVFSPSRMVRTPSFHARCTLTDVPYFRGTTPFRTEVHARLCVRVAAGAEHRELSLSPEQLQQTTQLYFSLYFTMTGLHALHMVIGVGIMLVITWMAWKGKFDAEYYTPVEMAGLYWHFVDLVWVFIFAFFYLW